MPELVQLIAWRWTGDKPLLNTLPPGAAYMRIYVRSQAII